MLRRLYSWYGKRVVWSGIGVILLLVVLGFVLQGLGGEDVALEESRLPLVTVESVADIAGGGTLDLVGVVKAVSEVRLESEVSGRITRVGTELGSRVAAGTVIAEIENARERAAVLQAEGAYEAALASSAQGTVSERDAATSFETAKISGINTYRGAFTTVDNVVRNLVDELFSNPDSSTPGFKMNSLGQANFLNNERKAIEVLLDSWSANLFPTPPTQDTALVVLEEAKNDVSRVNNFVDMIASIVENEQNKDAEVNGIPTATYKTRFVTARESLNTTLQNIENAQLSIRSAEETYVQAQIGSTGASLSVADGQVKQALGALRATQAALQDTIIRTPIAGVVNVLSVSTGDFVSARTPIALIANNNALEITTFVSESERSRISTDMPVRIAGRYTGFITNIAPAVDPSTKKIEVKIQTEATEIANGDTVRISIETNGEEADDGMIIIPITALKAEADRLVVFTISGDNTLVAHEIVEGPLVGNSIIIESGVTRDMAIVLDARGLNEGDAVDVAAN